MQMVRRRFSREPYQEYRSRLQQRWRPHILERDRHRCRVCGSKEDPEMAHITDCVAFSRAVGRKEGVTFSFRWDNLVTLCAVCHEVSHAHRLGPEEVDLRLKVQRFLERLRKLRGWHSPYAVLPPELVPERLKPNRSFHDCIRLTPLVPFPTYARYAADGGLVFNDVERPPTQSRLLAPEEAAAASPPGSSLSPFPTLAAGRAKGQSQPVTKPAPPPPLPPSHPPVALA